MDNESIITVNEDPAKKKSKKPLIITIAVSLALIAAITVISVWLISSRSILLPKAERSFEKTVSAILSDDLELIESIEKDGGILTVKGELMNDLLPSLEDNDTADLNMSVAFSPKSSAAKASASFKTGAKTVDAAITADGSGIAISSPSLLGEDIFTLPIEGLKASLDKSVFSPTKGSKYSLSTDTYEALTEIISQIEDPDMLDEDEQKVLTDFIKRVAKKQKNNLETEKKKGNLTLAGITKDSATLYEISFDHQLIYGVLDAFITELETNKELADIFDGLVTVPPGVTKSGSEHLGDTLTKFKNAMTESDILPGGSIQYLIQDGYMLAFVFELSDFKNSVSGAELLSMVFKTSGKPETDPSFNLTFSVSGSDVLYAEYKTKRDSALDLTVDTYKVQLFTDTDTVGVSCKITKEDSGKLSVYAEIGTQTKSLTLTAKGEYSEADGSRELKLTEIKTGQSYIMEISTFSLKLEASKQTVKGVSELGGKPLLAMTEEELDGVAARLSERLASIQDEINAVFGAELIGNKYTVVKSEPIALHNYAATAVCYDPYTAYYYSAATVGGHHYIFKTDPERPDGAMSVEVAFPIEHIDAYKGKLAFSYTTLSDNSVIQIYDGMTLEPIYEITKISNNYMKVADIVLTGNKLVCAAKRLTAYTCEIYSIDLTTYYELNFASSNCQTPSLAADREKNLIAICDNGITNCRLVVYNINATHRRIDLTAGSYNLPVFFQDGYFLAFGSAYSPDGRAVTRADITEEITYDTLAVFNSGIRGLYTRYGMKLVFCDYMGNTVLSDKLPAPIVDSMTLPNGDVLILAIGGADDLAFACRYSFVKTEETVLDIGALFG